MSIFGRLLGAGAILVLFCGALAQSAAAQTMERGPFLQTGAPTSIVVKWRTDQATDSVVDFGASPDTLAQQASEPALTTDHEVTLSGLSPDTRYYYAVGSTGAVLAGGDAAHSFVTAPLAGTVKPTRIWIIGDSGTANANAVKVREAYAGFSGFDPDLWLMLGDNAYNDGTDAEYQGAVFDMYPDRLRQMPVWSTLGNHDGHSADSPTETGPYYNIFTFPRNAEAGGVASGTEAYYSFDYGNIHFVNLDSYDTNRSVGGAMLTWLAADLAATSQDWIIAFWHHPPYTKGSHDSDTEGRLIDMRANALPILESFSVDLVLSGHSHSYERSFLIDGHYGTSDTLDNSMIIDGGNGDVAGDGAYTGAGTVYAVAGSSSKTSGGTLDHPVMSVSMSVLGSIVLDVYGNRLEGTFVDGDGNVIDRFTIENAPDTTAPVVRVVEALDATTVAVTFAERMRQTDATTAANYAIDQEVAVNQAILSADEKTVTLSVSPMTEDVAHLLTIANVTDLSGVAIAAANQTGFTYRPPVVARFQELVLPSAIYDGTRDAYISENLPGDNFGLASTLGIDGDDPGGSGLDLNALIAWDLTAIPTNARIKSATIDFNITGTSGSAYEVYEMWRDWHETEATWAEYASGAPWSGAGASGAGDRGDAVLASTGVNPIRLNDAGIAVIQDWVDGTEPNYGFLIADSGSGDGLDVSSSESGTATDHPLLTVIYTEPAPDAASHVGGIDMRLKTAGKKFLSAIATLTVRDDGGAVVANATVSAVWSDLTTASVNGVTDATGTVSFTSAKVSQSSVGTFTLTVTNVAATGLPYDADADVESWDCIDSDGVGCGGAGAPPPPTGLIATADTVSITLAWNASPDPTVTEYEVYRSTTSGGGYGSIGTATTTGYVDTTATVNVPYYYVVTAVDGAGDESAFPNETSATVSDGTPVALRVQPFTVNVVPDHKHWRGQATVVVVRDDDGALIEGALVTGTWEVLIAGGGTDLLGSESGTTDASGATVIISPKHRSNSNDLFRFTVTDIDKPVVAYTLTGTLFGVGTVP